MVARARYVRRRQASEAALGMVKGPRLTARAETAQRISKCCATRLAYRSLPTRTSSMAGLLGLLSTLLDKIAEVRLAELGSRFLVRRYIYWLQCTCVSAIVDDVCSGMEFSDTAKHIFDVIGEVRWPAQVEANQTSAGKHAHRDSRRTPFPETGGAFVRALLNGRITHWEGAAEIAVGTRGIRPLVVKLDVDRILKWITGEGHTNKDLADLLDMSERTVSSLRNNGDLHGQDAITKLANLMKVDPEDLYVT